MWMWQQAGKEPYLKTDFLLSPSQHWRDCQLVGGQWTLSSNKFNRGGNTRASSRLDLALQWIKDQRGSYETLSQKQNKQPQKTNKKDFKSSLKQSPLSNTKQQIKGGGTEWGSSKCQVFFQLLGQTNVRIWDLLKTPDIQFSVLLWVFGF